MEKVDIYSIKRISDRNKQELFRQKKERRRKRRDKPQFELCVKSCCLCASAVDLIYNNSNPYTAFLHLHAAKKGDAETVQGCK